MNAQAQAWASLARVQPVFSGDNTEICKLMSREGISFDEARERVLGERYAREQSPQEPIQHYADRRG
ncbi:MAG: hypothetical protein M3R16_08610 [Pseudomonadota bacterium]|nr:hypothetical protein [Pseudomonadota bacterium]